MINKNSFIYALSDPRTNEIKYVGQTTKGMLRPNQQGFSFYKEGQFWADFSNRNLITQESGE